MGKKNLNPPHSLPFDPCSFLHYGYRKRKRKQRLTSLNTACSSVHRWELALRAAAYLWEPNGSLPQAGSLCGEQEQR